MMLLHPKHRALAVLALAFAPALACAPNPEGPRVVERARPLTGSGRFRGSMPVRPIGEAPAICQVSQVTYYGGPVLQNIEILAVYWGPNIDTTLTTNLPLFYADVTSSTYLDWLSEYNTVGRNGADGLPGSNQGIGHGTYGGAFTITPSINATRLTDAQISTELVNQIVAGHLPRPHVGCDGQEKTLYFIEFPSGVSITDPSGGQSCARGGFCAYHNTTTLPDGTIIPYGIAPFMGTGSGCAMGCGAALYIDRVTSVHSHEIGESITDRDTGLTQNVGRPMGWYDNNCGEIGDICQLDGQIPKAGGGNWSVQTLWSNRFQQCIAAAPSPLPATCTATQTPAGCRPCTCADNGHGCSGLLPFCETAATNIKAGFCVQCTADTECTNASCTKSTSVATDDTCVATCGGVGQACCTPGNTCVPPQTCGGGGSPGVCGCTPVTCALKGDDCGTISNGCGGTIDCGTCALPGMCVMNHCVTPMPDAGFLDAAPPPDAEAAPDAEDRTFDATADVTDAGGLDAAAPAEDAAAGPSDAASSSHPDLGVAPTEIKMITSGGCGGCRAAGAPHDDRSPILVVVGLAAILTRVGRRRSR